MSTLKQFVTIEVSETSFKQLQHSIRTKRFYKECLNLDSYQYRSDTWMAHKL